jgi:hypothetical protein
VLEHTEAEIQATEEKTRQKCKKRRSQWYFPTKCITNEPALEKPKAQDPIE